MNFAATIKEYLLSSPTHITENLVLEVFRYQAQHNFVYHQYLNYLNCDIKKVQKTSQIPFLPIEFFKSHSVLIGNAATENLPATIFESSGTTGQTPSRHYVKDIAFYLDNAKVIFEQFYGKLTDYHILALLPSYLERTSSSLVAMIQAFMQHTAQPSGFYLNDYANLAEELKKLENSPKKVLLIGVTFGLLDFAEQFAMPLKNTIIMETGGMKGRRKELLREEVHQTLCEAFAVPAIHSEYGMTELLSQGYSKGQGIFQSTPTLQLYLRNMNDPFDIGLHLKDGGINVIDLANIDSCCFIETKDIGAMTPEGFKILGRYDNADVRGCNLMVL
ncbi:MAG: acyl transferase [Thermoflexibacteraceae bacterium]